MLANPKVSILMATYNRCEYLNETVKSIFEQTEKSLELVVVDDCSTDDTGLILSELKEKYFNIKTIKNVANIGLSKSLNIGLQNCDGIYIARIDDHDLWIDINKIEMQIRIMDRNKIDFLGSGYLEGSSSFINPLHNNAIEQQMLYRSPFCHVTMVMKKKAIDVLGGYNETLSYGEDWDLWLRAIQQFRMGNIPQITTKVKLTNHGMSSKNYLEQTLLGIKLVFRNRKYFGVWKTFKALTYHMFCLIFFKIIPYESFIHKRMKNIFRRNFLETSKVNFL